MPVDTMRPMGGTGMAATRPENSGMSMRAQALADIAMKILMQAAALVGPNTPQGGACIDALKGLGKAFPAPVSEDISAAEMKLLNARSGGGSMQPPSQGPSAMFQRMGIGGSPGAPGA